MGVKATSVAVLCWLSACALAARAADMNSIGPQVGSAQLISAHGSTSGPVLRITYDTTSASEKGRTILDVGTDFALVRRTSAHDPGGNATTLFDYALKRDISIDDAHRTIGNISSYAMVGFRYAESFNRRMLRKVLTEVGVNALPHMHNAFWDQQSLGIVIPGDDAASIEQRPTAHEGTEYLVDGLVGARFEPSENTLSPDEEVKFATLLWKMALLHPAVTKAIIASGRVPTEIEARYIMGDKQSVITWKLASVERTVESYPLPSGYNSNLLEPKNGLSAPLRDLLPTMLQAISKQYGGGPRTVESYRAALASDLADNQIFPYYVLDIEFGLQYGMGVTGCLNRRPEAQDCSSAHDIAERYLADTRTRAMLDSFKLEAQGDHKNAIAQRRVISRDGVPDAYVLDDFIGNTMTEDGKAGDPIPLIANAIKGNPYVGGFYKDLGDAFDRQFMPVDAWTCYDLARALPGGEHAPIVDGIAKKEAYLESNFPEFF